MGTAIRHKPPKRLLLSVFGALLLAAWVSAAQNTSAPSAFCHSTDGAFTVCPGGGGEWSDVPAKSFPETHSFLYASQADLDPAKGSLLSPVDTFMLMYDECGRTTPLGPDEYFLVSFKTVETDAGVEKLEHYNIHVFSDGTIIFVEDGVLQSPGRAQVVDGMRGDVGFGRSPNCAFDHVIAEFQIPLSVTGNSYSPDPLFWGASPPPPPPPECPEGQLVVPVLVNILSGVNGGAAATNSQVESAVQRASNILGQGGVCVTVSLIDRDAPDKGNGDGKLDKEEYGPLVDACVDELTSRFGRDVGYKITMVNEFSFKPSLCGAASGAPPSDDNIPLLPPIGPPTVGLRGYPCVFVRATCDDVGYNLAHEIGHTAGLGHLHGDTNNLMDPDTGGGNELSEGQRNAITIAGVRRHANSEHGAWTDQVGEVSKSFIDLRLGSLFSESLTSDLEISTSLAGLFPDTSPVNVRLNLLFDADDNPATGGTVGSHSGIDKRLEIALAGHFPFTDTAGTVTAALIDVASGASTVLTPGFVNRVSTIFDFTDESEDFADVIRQTVPFPLLGLASRRVPTTITTTDIDTGESDEASFIFLLSLTPGLGAIRPGFDANTLPANDDGSTGPVSLGFTANFFGNTFANVFVNNNGNVTFNAPLSQFTPFGLTATNRVIIAPFFADVDTRDGNVVTFGVGAVNGRPAFGANWPGVGCFSRNTNVLNFFQVVLIDRSDIGSGDFDIEFNYDSIQWETGEASGGNTLCQGGSTARVGFSAGTGLPGTFFELPGSGISGAFLDANTATGLIHNSLNSSQRGRYVLAVRNGVAVLTDRDADGVADELDNCPAVANPTQEDKTLNGLGDACETPGLLHSTAAFMQAGFNGSTFVQPVSLVVSNEPTLLDQLVRIVNFRVDAGLASSAETLTSNLVASLVALGLIPPASADALIAAVLQQVGPSPLRGDIDRDGDVDLTDLNFILSERGRPVGGSSCGVACDLDNDGRISALDARILVTLCTRLQCAIQ